VRVGLRDADHLSTSHDGGVWREERTEAADAHDEGNGEEADFAAWGLRLTWVSLEHK